MRTKAQWASIFVCSEQYNKASDLNTDWLLKWIKTTGPDKLIAWGFYLKSKEESRKLAKRLERLCHE